MTAIDHDEALAAAPRAEGRFAVLWSEFAENRLALGALAVVALLIVVALLAPFITPQNPYDLTQLSILDNMLPPGGTSICSAPTTRAATCSRRSSTACG
jgi:peptide/nickel transport system permease protein